MDMNAVLNPLVQQLIGTLVRIVLVAISGEQLTHAIDEGKVDEIAKALAPGIIATGWAVYNAFKGRKKLVTAMGLTTPVSEHQLAHIIATSESTPSVTLPKTEVPLTCPDCPPPPAAA